MSGDITLSHRGLERVNGNQMFVSISAVRRVGEPDDICLLYYGLFDLFRVQMGCHTSCFLTANSTVTNDSGCDPMTRIFTRTNNRPDEWAVLAAESLQYRFSLCFHWHLGNDAFTCHGIKHKNSNAIVIFFNLMPESQSTSVHCSC